MNNKNKFILNFLFIFIIFIKSIKTKDDINELNITIPRLKLKSRSKKNKKNRKIKKISRANNKILINNDNKIKNNLISSEIINEYTKGFIKAFSLIHKYGNNLSYLSLLNQKINILNNQIKFSNENFNIERINELCNYLEPDIKELFKNILPETNSDSWNNAKNNKKIYNLNISAIINNLQNSEEFQNKSESEKAKAISDTYLNFEKENKEKNNLISKNENIFYSSLIKNIENLNTNIDSENNELLIKFNNDLNNIENNQNTPNYAIKINENYFKNFTDEISRESQLIINNLKKISNENSIPLILYDDESFINLRSEILISKINSNEYEQIPENILKNINKETYLKKLYNSFIGENNLLYNLIFANFINQIYKKDKDLKKSIIEFIKSIKNESEKLDQSVKEFENMLENSSLTLNLFLNSLNNENINKKLNELNEFINNEYSEFDLKNKNDNKAFKYGAITTAVLTGLAGTIISIKKPELFTKAYESITALAIKNIEKPIIQKINENKNKGKFTNFLNVLKFNPSTIFRNFSLDFIFSAVGLNPNTRNNIDILLGNSSFILDKLNMDEDSIEGYGLSFAERHIRDYSESFVKKIYNEKISPVIGSLIGNGNSKFKTIFEKPITFYDKSKKNISNVLNKFNFSGYEYLKNKIKNKIKFSIKVPFSIKSENSTEMINIISEFFMIETLYKLLNNILNKKSELFDKYSYESDRILGLIAKSMDNNKNTKNNDLKDIEKYIKENEKITPKELKAITNKINSYYDLIYKKEVENNYTSESTFLKSLEDIENELKKYEIINKNIIIDMINNLKNSKSITDIKSENARLKNDPRYKNAEEKVKSDTEYIVNSIKNKAENIPFIGPRFIKK